jgi:hypothetical protein
VGLTAGQIALDTDFAAIEAASTTKPVVQVYLSGVQSIPDNTLTALSFGSENFDSHGFHSVSVDPSRLIPNIAGIYRMTGVVYFAGRTDWSQVKVVSRKNGSTELAPSMEWGNVVTTGTHGFRYSGLIAFNGTTDYVEMCVLQNNGANVAVNALAGNPSISLIEMEYIRGPL